MTLPWIPYLDLIRNGEPISEEVPNRPLTQLSQRTDYLKALVDILSAGASIVDTSAPLTPDVQEGDAVYWNKTLQQFDRALAALDYTEAGNYGGNADSAYMLGVCGGKTTTTSGVVVFYGKATGVDFSNAIEGGGALEAGPYFLSASNPGKLTKDRPPVGIYAMFGLANGDAVVAPSPREVLENHTHYKITLAYGNTLSTTAGWSNVMDADLKPSNARFRYTIEADTQAYELFPFYPPDGVYFEIDGIGANEKVTIDNNGIWWIDADRDPDEYNTMIVYYARPTTNDISSIVRSLQPATDNALMRITDCNGVDATAGDLYVHLDLLLQSGADTTPGWVVMKSLTDDQQIARGPVVESVRSASPEISVEIDSSQGATGDDGGKAGKLVVRYNEPTNLVRQLQPTLTEMFGALQEDYNNIPYVGLPSRSYESAVSMRFDTSADSLTGTFEATFECWLYSSQSGSFSSTGLAVDFTVIRNVSDTAAYSLTDATKVLTYSTYLTLLPNNTLTANGYRPARAVMEGISVQPGDQIHVKLTRQDAAAYAGTVGLLKHWLELNQE